MISSLSPLFALITPFILWPVEIFLPYPAIIEELAKGLLVYIGKTLPNALLIGAVFAFSESVLYLPNIITSGNINLLFARLILTTILHSTTCLLMSLSLSKSRYGLLLSLLPSIIIHSLYNHYLNSYS